MIIASHRERRITIHRRDAAGAWTMRVAIAGGRITAESLGAELIVDAIYPTPRSPDRVDPARRARPGRYATPSR